MAHKILIAECRLEISSFNPAPTRYKDFEINVGNALLDYHVGLNTEIAGALSVFNTRDDNLLVPAYGARSITSGGVMTSSAWQRILDEFRQQVTSVAPVDAAYLSLHGAMAAADEVDPEGALLEALRELVGEAIPVVISLDLHGIVTDKMLTHSDAITAFHTYPHVDFADTGRRAAELLLKVLDGTVWPVTAWAPIPALVRGDELITETGLFGRMIRKAQEIESGPGGLAAGMFIGNPFTDVPELRSNSFVTTDNDADLAQRMALALAHDFWRVHEQLQAPLDSLEDSIALAFSILQDQRGTVIMKDPADATSSGASGDSNIIVRGLLDAGYTGTILAPIVDAPAVQAAFAVGVGATIQTTIGGQIDPVRFTPLPIRAYVQMLSDGNFVSESNGAVWHGGQTAVLQSDALTIVATSRPVSLYDRSLFLGHGQDPARFDAVIVKSPHCQPLFFDDWAAAVVNLDVPGSTSANLPTLGHTKCARPIYPLDADVVYEPTVKLYQRPRTGMER